MLTIADLLGNTVYKKNGIDQSKEDLDFSIKETDNLKKITNTRITCEIDDNYKKIECEAEDGVNEDELTFTLIATDIDRYSGEKEITVSIKETENDEEEEITGDFNLNLIPLSGKTHWRDKDGGERGLAYWNYEVKIDVLDLSEKVQFTGYKRCDYQSTDNGETWYFINPDRTLSDFVLGDPNVPCIDDDDPKKELEALFEEDKSLEPDESGSLKAWADFNDKSDNIYKRTFTFYGDFKDNNGESVTLEKTEEIDFK